MPLTKITGLVLFLSVSVGLVCTPFTANGQDEKPELKTMKQKASYLVGFDIGQDVLRRELDVDHDLLVKGFLDAVAEKQPPMTATEIAAVMEAFEKQVQSKLDAKWKSLSKTNMEKGLAFLEKNKLAKGIIQLESGLQYRVLSKGDGAKPKNGNQVKIHVIGKRLDSTEFENTYTEKMPVTLTVGVSLRGLDDALRRMSVGSKWELFIPSNLAFGPNGSPPAIGPNESLVYVVELLEVVK